MKLGIVIADVSGKGVGAGLIMATAKATLKSLSQQEGLTPKQILTKANTILYEYTNGDKFISMLYLEWNTITKKLTYSSAGHEHILICRAAAGSRHLNVGYNNSGEDSSSGHLNVRYNESPDEGMGHLNAPYNTEVEAIKSGGLVLGMLPDIEAHLKDNEIILNPNDKILLYTDGVTEAQNPQQEQFGLERLKESFRKHCIEILQPSGLQDDSSGKENFPMNQLIQAIKTDIYNFISTQAQYDDITLVALEAVST